MTSDASISHAFVLPDQDFYAWLDALSAYSAHFPRVAVVRSPAAYDLNRYRNVSAVAAPLTWFQDDPVQHIRRIYPMVVRVDVVRARTPQQLRQILGARVAADDRFGQSTSEGPHIYDRFVLDWPVASRPLQVTRRFDPRETQRTPGIELLTSPGVPVIASASGRVTGLWNGRQEDGLRLGRYVQVTTPHLSGSYTVTYAGLRQVTARLNQSVDLGAVLGTTDSDRLTLVVQQPGAGTSGLRLPDVIDPLSLIYVQDLRLRATDVNLRVRSIPRLEGRIVGRVQPWDSVEPLEPHGRTLAKVGQNEQWVQLRLPDGKSGYSAAWFLEAFTRDDTVLFPGVNPVGVNLDARHALGTPDPSRLGKLGWIRMAYNVANFRGSEDIDAALNRYLPLVERYRRAGYRLIFTLTHQTYGEGKDHFWPWHGLPDDRWQQLINGFVATVERIARQWAGRGLVDVWQVWNEQDANNGAPASVPVPTHHYAALLRQTSQVLRAVDSQPRIITGGHIGGPLRGAEYAREVLSQLGSAVAYLDGIAVHPYGRGTTPGPPYAPFGHIDESVRAYVPLLPDKPLWITEWGVLDRPDDPPQEIANYATSFITHLRGRYPGRIACMIWYAWAQGMHNGYGLVDSQGRPRSPLTERMLG